MILWLRFYDMEKAYPKVSRPGLWRLLQIKGCPPSFLKVLKAIHDHTSSFVRFEGAQSHSFVPDRGLREGCPSSPVLFNIYHSGIMEVFRARRSRLAQTHAWTPGILWSYKVDGKLGKRRLDRLEEGRNVKTKVIGDFAYADDTGIVGTAEEVRQAENLFDSTLHDFAGRLNRDKTEGLKVSAEPAPPTEVPFLGESTTVKHVGALLHARGSHAAETTARVAKCIQKLGWVASSWGQGKGTHRNKRRVKFSVRVRVMKTVVKGVLSSFSKTRAWQSHQLLRCQKVINKAIRRCLGVRMGMIHHAGLSNSVLHKLTQWESFENMVRRATLMWVGHVARMSIHQPQKAMMFGWLHDAKAKPHAPSRQAQWVNGCFKVAGIPESDWFRLAQNKAAWRRLVHERFPPETVDSTKERQLDSWSVGRPLPAFAQTPHQPEDMEMGQGSDDNVGDVRRGRPRGRARRMYRQAQRPGVAVGQRQQRAHRNAAGDWECPVCQMIFTKANQLTFHYEASHAVTDPDLVTVPIFSCSDCSQHFRRRTQLDSHTCPAKQILPRLSYVDPLASVDGVSQESTLSTKDGIYLFTDGSGGTGQGAGWGVAIYDTSSPVPESRWVAALYGPVLTLSCDPEYLGATSHTNNTAELTAIGEACKWLLDFCDSDVPSKPPSATILYDSTYAYGMATRPTSPTTNHTLVEAVAALVTQVRLKIPLHFRHVRGHTGVHGNEIADRLADRGVAGRVSPHAKRWVRVPVGPMGGGAPAAVPQAKPKPKPKPKPKVLRRPAAAHPAPKPGARPGYFVCPHCFEEFSRGNLNQHEPICRGPDPANRTCQYCNTILSSVIARKNHERYTHSQQALADGLISAIPKRSARQG